MDYRIRVYGTEGCPDTMRSRTHLAQRGIDYEFIDMDQDSDADNQVRLWNDGKRKRPTIVIESKGETRRLTEPSNDELDHALQESHVDSEGAATTRRSGLSSGGREDKVA